MSDTVSNLRSLQAATERAYEIRRLFHAGAVERTAALLSLSVLRCHPHAAVGRLCERVAADIDAAGSAGGGRGERFAQQSVAPLRSEQIEAQP